MSKPGRRAAILLMILAGAADAQEGLIRERISFPLQGRADIAATAGELYVPGGKGPFAAVVILHGCGGVAWSHHRWAQEIAQLGMVALVADHFGPRGIERICERDRGQVVEQRERRRDTLGALEYLRKRADVDPGRIAVMGMSNGGSATINAAIPGLNDPQDLRFKAAIALYPDCVGYAGLKLDTPLLILIGERDDWTPAADCRDLIERLPKESAPARMEVFPKAEHSFDDEAQQTMYLARVLNSHAWTRYGATVGYQAAARSEAVRLVREFLQQRLAPAPPR